MKPEFSTAKLDEYRSRFKLMLEHIGLKKLFIPPPECCLGADLRLYNDGGVARKDWERPQHSFTCGFLLQVFNPRPLGTREVWLPDYATKTNNTFWMTVCRQLLLNCSWFPSDIAEETYERIVGRLSESHFGYFDISAFGLQYPRELLVIAAEEISHYYPNPDLMDQTRIFIELITRKFSVQTSPTSFVYPTRGIGLGYYEDLKTLGMMAILMPWRDNVISLYGDQGLISLFRKNYSFLKTVINELRDFQFIIKDEKVDTKLNVVKWSGWTMGSAKVPGGRLAKRCQTTSSFCAIFDGVYHWERKIRISAFYKAYPEYMHRMKRFAFDYESTYGYEFVRGDAFNSHLQCGVSPHERVFVGETPFFRVERLQTPQDKIIDNLVFSTPLFMQWKETESRRFSNYRRKIFTSTRGSSELFEYMNPKYSLLGLVKYRPTHVQRAVSDRMELRLIALSGLSTGKFTYGLDSSSWHSALWKYSLAKNPFEAMRTGGYSVATRWHHPRRVSAEWLFIVKVLMKHVDQIDGNYANYYSDFSREADKFEEEIKSLPKKKRKLKEYPPWGNPPKYPRLDTLREDPETVRFSLDSFNTQEVADPTPYQEFTRASDILSDFKSRLTFNDHSEALFGEDSELEDMIDVDDIYDYESDISERI